MTSSSVLNGLKVLSDAPGFDAWHDTSTLYIEGSEPSGRYRGILRVPLDTFLGQQLPSIEISGHLRCIEEKLGAGGVL